MTSSNRVRVALVRELVPGVTPATPRMRTMRVTDAGLTAAPTFVDSDEVRDDRMNADPILVFNEAGGSLPYELSFPEDNSPLSEIYRSAFRNPWVNLPFFDNDGTPDSVITDAGTTANTYVVAAGGTAVKAGHLVRATGFGVAANNKPSAFRATSSTGTTIVGTGLGLSAEAAPPGTARLKVIGFEGASGDITALADGLGSTALDFTTLSLPLYWFVKIGGTPDASTFAFLVTAGTIARKAAWARIVGISANKLTLDNLPVGWTTDAGAGKTIRVFVPDSIKNGVTQSTYSIERGYLGQATPSYPVNLGMDVKTLTETTASRDKIKGTATFTGMGFVNPVPTTPLDASPDAATTNQVMAANANVGNISEAGARLTSPNWCKSLTWTIENNLRTVEDVQSQNAVGINDGNCDVTVRIEPLFGDATLMNKFYSGLPTSIAQRVQKNNQAIVRHWPRLTYRGDGNPTNQARNNDVMLPLEAKASYDPTTAAHMLCGRHEYYED